MVDNAAILPGARITRAPSLVRNQVANYLRQAIVAQELRPGQVLVERELCEATTASRGSIREALRQLESEGLVVSESGRGTVVATLTKAQALHIYAVREALEGLAGRLFACNATDDDRAGLKAAVDRMSDLVDSPADLLAAADEFYAVLLVGGGNPELKKALDLLHRRITLTRVNSLAVAGRATQSIREMRAILDAAVSPDAQETERLCVEHVRNASAAAWSESG